MAYAEVGGGTQRNTNSGDNTPTIDVAFPGNVTAGSLVVCCGGFWNASDAASVTITPTGGSTAVIASVGTIFSTGLAWSGGFGHSFIKYGYVTNSGSLTFTIAPSTGSGNYINGAVDEFSGANSSPLDVDGGQASWGPSAGTFTVTDTITTLTDNDLIVGVLIADSGFSGSLSPGSGYTQIGEDETSNRQSYGAEFQIVGAAGSKNVTWDVSTASRSGFVINAAFKEATAAADPLIGAFMMA